MMTSIFTILLHIILIFTLAWFVWRKQSLASKKYFWPALVFKLICGVCLGWLYTYYYSVADTFVYFEDAASVAALARQDISAYLAFLVRDSHVTSLQLTYHEPRALFLTKLTSVFYLVSAGNYWVIGFYFSFISFLAAWHLVETVIRNIPDVRSAAATAFLFFPSVVFWTSGLLKESLAMAGLFFIAAMFCKVWFKARPRRWEYPVMMASIVVLWKLKYYYAAVFIPVTLTSLIYKFLIPETFKTSAAVRILVWAGVFILPLMLVTFSHPNFSTDRLFRVIVTNNAAYAERSDPEDMVHFDALRPTPLSIIAQAPRALFAGLFRPLVWEANTRIQLIAGIENVLLLLLFVAALLRFRKLLHVRHPLLVLTIIVYVCILCVFITISAPNFGTLSRYRVGYLPFFIFIILCDNPVVQYLERSFSRLVSH